MRAVVTGVAGFIGSHIAEHLIAEGAIVLGIDDLSGGLECNVPQGVRFEKLSVNGDLVAMFQDYRPDVVFHFAAYAAEGLSHHIPIYNYMNNVLGTVNVLSASYKAGAKHFVYTSSIAAYGHPHSEHPFDESSECRPCDPYGAAKLACEHHIRSFHDYFGRPTFTIFRPHNVFGPRQNIADPYRNVVGIFMLRALHGLPMPVFGDGRQTRSFSHIGCVAKAIASAPRIPAACNATFNIGGDESMSVRQLAETIATIFGREPLLEYMPPRSEVLHAHCSHELARAVFASAYADSLSIRDGLIDMMNYVRQHTEVVPTEFPGSIEISDRLPEAWAKRLVAKGISSES